MRFCHWWVLLQGTLIAASGVSVHLLLMSRIHSQLPEDVKPFYSYLQAGAFFPDSYYNCFGDKLDEAAEDAHWPPFLLSAAKYHHHQQGKPKVDWKAAKMVHLSMANSHHDDDDNRKKFRAFLYGIFSHQIADATWHSIRMNHGLLSHLAALEFDGDVEAAHSFLDTGGDLLVLRKLSANTDIFSKEQSIQDYFMVPWKAPIKEMVEIYHRLGHYDVSDYNMKFCLNRGFTGLSLEMKGYKLSSHAYIEQSPHLYDILDDYYLGGLEEIETSILRCMPNLDEWLDDANSELNNMDPWELCRAKLVEPRTAATLQDNHQVIQKSLNDDGYFVSPMVPNGRFGKDIELGNFLGEQVGLCAAVGSIYEDLDGTIYIIPLMGLRALENVKMTKVNQSIKKVSGSPEKYGYKIKNFVVETVTGDNIVIRHELLVVVSPGSGTVDIIKGSNTLLRFNFGGEFEQMGTDFELADMNGDGIEDFVFSSPFSGKNQRGSVVVLDGKKILIKVLTESPQYFQQDFVNVFVSQDYPTNRINAEIVDVSYKEFDPIILTIPDALRLSTGYENFGSTISVSGEYLYVGVTSISRVLVYDKLAITTSSSKSLPKFIIPHYGGAPYEFDGKAIPRITSRFSGQFGSKFMASGTYDGVEWILIGAHSESYSNCKRCGGLYLYTIVGNHCKLVTKVIMKVDSFPEYDLSFSKFGISGHLDANGTTVYISSPYLNNTGAIWKFDVSTLLEISTATATATPDVVELEDIVAIGVSGNGYTGFGNALKTYCDVYGETRLIVGLPDYGYRELANDAWKLVGRVGIYTL
ncbi:hypothetical protein DASC09_028980 [Saccharomycopsis crataegensis]|uniref:Phospholipase C/D domain-containing protein n=1 Tax=Saccharomycopsis crataegensis TaxID=43959 RepID=A0AAV5QLB5_9ASCO|nr:hypothetical protein DASC09_028980 [Saccharomycopsis crataegensis]